MKITFLYKRNKNNYHKNQKLQVVNVKMKMNLKLEKK